MWQPEDTQCNQMHKSDEGAIIQNTALSDQADKPHTNISLRIKQTGFRPSKKENY